MIVNGKLISLMASAVSVAKVSEINKGKGPKSSGHGNSHMSPFG